MDHFKDFKERKGFGINGTYLIHYREDIVNIARRILGGNKGRRVVLRYDHTQNSKKLTCLDDSSESHENWVTIPRNGSLDRLLEGVKTDNIEMVFLDGEQEVFELQYIEVVDQWVIELRKHDIGSDHMKGKLRWLEAYRNA